MESLKSYIGVKEINARQMNLGDYNRYRGWQIPEDEDPEKEGYLVVYPDGYESWSPKQQFDDAYKEVKALIVISKKRLPHQDRVVEEAEELSLKIVNLNKFIKHNDIFISLTPDEQLRLKQQLLSMKYYATVLIERIKNF